PELRRAHLCVAHEQRLAPFPLDTSEPAGLRSSILWHDQMIHVLYAANGTLRYARFSPSCGG
ncbi:MAG: hypothetical protein VB934_04050, partial [Polyangiaceae bacterium]